MKKILLLVLTLSLVFGLVYAKQMTPPKQPKAIELDVQGKSTLNNRNNEATYTFTIEPTSLITSYYDYMIGSYNSIPLRWIKNPDYPGYFLTFHGQRTAGGTRRVFYAHLDAEGNVININEITAVDRNEGYPGLAVDPVSGKPMYAWHANADPSDAELEVEFVSDAFMFGFSGLFNAIQVIMDNPSHTVPGYADDNDNEFIWPTVEIGPSPIDGKRRVYVSSRNAVSHASSDNPSENPLIAYADFDEDMLEADVPLEWSYTSIPTLNDWNHDQAGNTIRPYNSLLTDDIGNLYYVGYHNGWDSEDEEIEGPKVDIFKAANYGEGQWEHIGGHCEVPTWNPITYTNENDPLFGDIGEFTNLNWDIVNSGHLNAAIDNRGRAIFPALWCVSAGTSYWPSFHTVKAMIWDPADNSFNISEIYPQKNPADTFNAVYTHWDVEAPFGEEDYEYPPTVDYGVLQLTDLAYPFPHWDQSLHSDAMYFHYSNLKVSEVNEEGMMVAVWQDSYRAKQKNEYEDDDYLAYANTPEIWISVSANEGDDWSDPIILNNVDTPNEFAGIKPMWVYPADVVQYMGTVDGKKVGKIGFMFYDDNTWGSNAISPSAHPTPDGGDVMFMEMQITFPNHTDSQNVSAPAITRMLNPNYPNPFNPETNISFDLPKAGNAKVEVFNVKGQLVKTLYDGFAPYGRTSLVWNGTNSSGAAVSSGVYFYRLSANGFTETRKMMMMK